MVEAAPVWSVLVPAAPVLPAPTVLEGVWLLTGGVLVLLLGGVVLLGDVVVLLGFCCVVVVVV